MGQRHPALDCEPWRYSNAGGGRRFRRLPTRADSQVAFVLYTRAEGGEREWRVHSVQVLGTDRDCSSSLTLFMRPVSTALVPAFGVPLTIQDNLLARIGTRCQKERCQCLGCSRSRYDAK